jgi:DNA-binding CsgD family transcriptional regulator
MQYQRLKEVLEQISHAASEQELIGTLDSVADEMGWPYIALLDPQADRPHQFLTTVPNNVIQLYQTGDFIHRDPVVIESNKTITPLIWTKAAYEKTLPADQLEWLAAQEDISGINGGCIINMRRPWGTVYGGVRTTEPITTQDTLPLPAIMQQASVALHKLRNAAVFSSVTPREREVLRHLMHRRKMADVAADLGITLRTIEFHVDCLKVKLNAVKTPQLIAQAFRIGLLPQIVLFLSQTSRFVDFGWPDLLNALT